MCKVLQEPVDTLWTCGSWSLTDASFQRPAHWLEETNQAGEDVLRPSRLIS